MLIIAWIVSEIPLTHANKTEQVLAQGRHDRASRRLMNAEQADAENVLQEQKQPTAWEEIQRRLAWIVPVTLFGCVAGLAVFAWVVSWLDKR